jgi:hypothetical protein
MKVTGVLLFILTFTNSSAQNLKNTEWIRFLTVDKKDASTTISNLESEKLSIKYYFLDSTALISLNDQYSNKQKYSVNDSILLIGDFLKFKIDSASDQILVLSGIPKKGMSSDNLTTLTFLNTDYLFDYLKLTQQLTIINDSLILDNNFLSPSYKGEIADLFFSEFIPAMEKDNFTGFFTILKDGNITDIQIPSDKKSLQKAIEIIIRILKSTKGSWIIPPTPKPYDFKVSFTLRFSHPDPLLSVGFTLHPNSK